MPTGQPSLTPARRARAAWARPGKGPWGCGGELKEALAPCAKAVGEATPCSGLRGEACRRAQDTQSLEHLPARLRRSEPPHVPPNRRVPLRTGLQLVPLQLPTCDARNLPVVSQPLFIHNHENRSFLQSPRLRHLPGVLLGPELSRQAETREASLPTGAN